jgi:hypothetical protein
LLNTIEWSNIKREKIEHNEYFSSLRPSFEQHHPNPSIERGSAEVICQQLNESDDTIEWFLPTTCATAPEPIDHRLCRKRGTYFRSGFTTFSTGTATRPAHCSSFVGEGLGVSGVLSYGETRWR